MQTNEIKGKKVTLSLELIHTTKSIIAITILYIHTSPNQKHGQKVIFDCLVQMLDIIKTVLFIELQGVQNKDNSAAFQALFQFS